jgi:hypothetical protein
MSDLSTLLLGGSVIGIAGGLWLLAQGLASYRRAGRVADTATSRIGMLAVGEVRVTGRIEPAELTLVSPLQSRTCVYYRARIRERDSRDERTVLDDERAVGFRVRDDTGAIRVFPRGGTWDVPSAFKDSDGFLGEAPAGVSLRMGPALEPATPDRDALVARLLTVRPALGGFGVGAASGSEGVGRWDPFAAEGRSRRRDYEEARIEPGDTVTVVGTAMPFDQLPDPAGADLSDGEAVGGPLAATADPEIAADLAAARAAGVLETDPTEAWGNAAIPGFGIDQPVRPPELDEGARSPAVVDGETADRFQRTFEIGPDELVLAIGRDRPLLVSFGPPATVVDRGRDRFLVGLFGAVLAIASALLLALVLTEGVAL